MGRINQKPAQTGFYLALDREYSVAMYLPIVTDPKLRKSWTRLSEHSLATGRPGSPEKTVHPLHTAGGENPTAPFNHLPTVPRHQRQILPTDYSQLGKHGWHKKYSSKICECPMENKHHEDCQSNCVFLHCADIWTHSLYTTNMLNTLIKKSCAVYIALIYLYLYF